LGSDLVVPGDYDGDGKTDYAVVRQGSQYFWYVLRSSGGFLARQLGTKPHYTTQGDYDGDGKTDVSVFDPGSGFFYVTRSSDGVTTFTKFGQNGDYPVANFDTH
ncbi:MAG: VCBS repeat-containing protein, partial [Pyrinomonadaceae bacterium]